MATINIPEADEITYRDFIAGHAVQVRAITSDGMDADFKKGQRVEVAHLNMKSVGKIVSDPLTILNNTNADDKVLSLIIEKVS